LPVITPVENMVELQWVHFNQSSYDLKS
jgi:hypothetical protein